MDSPLEERALGVYWRVEDDAFSYNIKKMDKPHTRRGLLSMLSSVYDPLGLAGPFILKARRIVQELCHENYKWDDPIPEQQEEEWKQWTTELEQMEEVRIPRCLHPKEFGVTAARELHHFADASEIAYGVVSYLKIINDKGNIHTVLVMAKSRLAPMKHLTIPRLELCAAVLAARQDSLLRREMDLQLQPSHFWSDSTIVLRYIANEERRFQTFVANRVTEIRERTNPKYWHHIPTKENPADDASRGISPVNLATERWIQGPAFLRKGQDEWPKQTNLPPLTIDDEEVKKPAITMNIQVEEEDDLLNKLIKRYSSWHALVKATAWILAIKTALRERALTGEHKPLPDPPNGQAMKKAEASICEYVQKKHFPGDHESLAKNRQPTQGSPIAKLQPILKENVICVDGRLKHAQVPEEARCPAIIPKDSHIAELIV